MTAHPDFATSGARLRALILALLSTLAMLTPGAQAVPPDLLGARAANVIFYYEDVAAAARFYREHLGLLPMAGTGDRVVLEVAPGATITLADVGSAGYDADTPRTAAIALVTDQLDAWWEALSDRDLNMRTQAYDPVPGRAHHGFVLIDPEGYFLEFERFNPHPENVDLLPRLASAPTRLVDHRSAGLPEGLGFKATIVWFYYADLATAETFVLDTLGLPLITDQDWAKIHPVAPAAYLGLVDGARGMHGFTEQKAVAFEILDARTEAWRRWFDASGIQLETIDAASLEILDPGGYRLRWRTPAMDTR